MRRDILQTVWEGKKFPAHQVARKKNLADQKYAMLCHAGECCRQESPRLFTRLNCWGSRWCGEAFLLLLWWGPLDLPKLSPGLPWHFWWQSRRQNYFDQGCPLHCFNRLASSVACGIVASRLLVLSVRSSAIAPGPAHSMASAADAAALVTMPVNKNPKSCHQNFKSCCLNFLQFL